MGGLVAAVTWESWEKPAPRFGDPRRNSAQLKEPSAEKGGRRGFKDCVRVGRGDDGVR